MTIEEVRREVADSLARLEPLFDKRCKLSFIMRSPHLPDGDLVVTSDDVDAVIAALGRFASKGLTA